MKPNKNITRQDIAELLSSIAPPSQKRAEKIEAVKALGLYNTQGHGVELTLETFKEF